jgi:hypothetical protein
LNSLSINSSFEPGSFSCHLESIADTLTQIWEIQKPHLLDSKSRAENEAWWGRSGSIRPKGSVVAQAKCG